MVIEVDPSFPYSHDNSSNMYASQTGDDQKKEVRNPNVKYDILNLFDFMAATHASPSHSNFPSILSQGVGCNVSVSN